jgi:hypothetical protein
MQNEVRKILRLSAPRKAAIFSRILYVTAPGILS